MKDDGPDRCDLHENRIMELIHSGVLSDKQLKDLEKYPEVNKAPIQKRYLRSLAIRRLRNEGLTDITFQVVKNSTDSALHEFALEMEGLNREYLVWLSRNGLNKRVRNISKQRLNSRLYRE